jgi:glycosyltransferase involved in cell wall biosynthesis
MDKQRSDWLNLVHLAKFYPPEWGGIERVTYDLVVGMAAQGISSHVVSFTRDPLTAGTSGDAAVKLTRCRMFANPFNQPLSASWLWHAVRAGSTSDAVIVHAPNLLALPVMLILALMRVLGRGPRHQLLLWHSDIVDKGALGKIIRPLELAMAKLSTRVIATSPPYAKASPILRHLQNKVVTIPLGISTPELTASEIEPQLADWIGGRPMILAVGRLVPYKGFDFLVEAVDLIEGDLDFCCVIVGTGPEYSRLRAQIMARSLENRISIVGSVSMPALLGLFNKAAVYCMVSQRRAEAFGVALLEAMMHGVPIITTDISGSGVRWVAGCPDAALSVPVNDASALTAALSNLLQDAALANQLRAAGKQRFNEHFTREKMVANWIALLQNLNSSNVFGIKS